MKDTAKTTKAFEKALFALLKTQNYRDITVNGICALASKTKMTFYHYYKSKDDLLAVASINLINEEYEEESQKILSNETDLEEIEYQSLVATHELVARHYTQISNLAYNGDTLPLLIFKNALYENYSRYISEIVRSGGYDVPTDFLSVFCFEGLYGSCLFYAEKLKNSKSKKKTREDARRICRLLAKAVVLITKET